MKTGLKNTKIAVVGAGFAGLRCAKLLCRFCKDVALFDRNDYHLYLPLLYELDESEVKLPIRTHANFIQREIDDPHELLAEYDYVVVATGAEVNYCDIPGLKEYAITFKKLEDIERLKNIPAGDILIVGGGVTGVELAAELAIKLEGERLTVIEAREHILPRSEDKTLQNKVIKRLNKLGVKIITGRYLKQVDQHRVYFSNGEQMKYDNLVWTGGVKLGKYKVDENLRVNGESRLFAIGDCASANPGMIHPALEQAGIVSTNIKRIIEGGPSVVYKPKDIGIVIPLGGWYAVGKIGTMRITGLFAYFAKALIHFIYRKTYAGK